jgi:serine/threonine protein kinase
LTACARVMSLAAGGQILLTRAVFDSARQVLKGEDIPPVGPLTWVNHGPYLLKGVEEPVEVCEVGESAARSFEPPKTSEKAARQIRPDEEPVLGWRPAVGQAVPNTPWVLEEKLGEGGFGEVWRGRHRQLKDDRVFKFCFRADRVRSLRREVTLFRLLKERVGDHPRIVRLYDVYFDQPPYYLEEEYVPGKDLRTWCEAQGGVAKVPLATRLEIAAQAADALQAAHDAGIIHRDVKPGNILIGPQVRSAANGSTLREGAPLSGEAVSGVEGEASVAVKLADFGIGQVVSEEYLAGMTRAGFTETMMSPASSSQTGTQLYMAPELFAGNPASTRSDIYSLGVVLYQLLVGSFSRPLMTDWADGIEDPLLRDDLRHCFAGRAEDRFAGASQLARNLRNLAARQSALAQEEAKRAALEQAAYRRGIMRTAAVAAAVVLLVVGLAAAAWHQSRRAREEALTAQKVSTFLIDLFQVSDPGEARGRTITAREILDRGAQRIQDELGGEPLVQARLMDTMGRVYRKLGLHEEAGPLLEKAVAIRRETLGTQHLEVAESLNNLGNVLWDQGKYVEARPLFTEALSIREASSGPDTLLTAASCHDLANNLLFQGDYKEARPLYLRALTIREKILGPSHAIVAQTLNSLGALEYRMGDTRQAKAVWERCLSIREQTLGDDHYFLAMTCNNLGLVCKDLAEYAAAEAYLERAIQIQEKVLGPEHPNLASGLHNLAEVNRRTGDLASAKLLLERAVTIRERATGPEHPELARILLSLAEVLREMGDLVDAAPLYERAFSIHQKVLGLDNAEAAFYRAGLANLYRDQGRRAEAEALYREVLTDLEGRGTADLPAAAEILANVAKLYRSWGRDAEAEEYAARAVKALETVLGSEHPEVVALRRVLSR